MFNKRFGKNLFLVAFSRLVSLASGVLVGLLLPKMFSITDYGYYKVYTLYAVYTALLHFGFVDGLLLKLAGKDYDELDRGRMRAYARFFIAFEGLILFVMVGAGLLFLKGEYLFVLLMLAVNMMIINLTTYYQFVSQAVQRFGEYSAKSLMVSVAKLIFVCALFLLYYFDISHSSYRIYLIGITVFDFLMLFWYIVKYNDITFGKSAPLKDVRKDLADIFKTGIVLTLAYQVSHFVLALDRQFVNVLYTTETFAVYSFAYNIVTMISTMISSVAIVLLPMLKNNSKEYVKSSYKKCVTGIALISSVSLLCYYPFAAFIRWFLPDYAASLEYISIVMPSLLFTSVITVVIFTVAKVMDMNMAFFKDSCVVLVLSLAANYLAYLIFDSPKAISYASLLVMVMWLIISSARMRRKIGEGITKDTVYLVIVSAGFILISVLGINLVQGFLCYLGFLALCTVAFYKGLLIELKELITHRKK
ncbi:MAG: hypothetical protein IJB76_01405 [Clostridia bacterium]|nr:hypothetical protein [Clostridia bacterium]